jgi:hypothetical protein
MQLFCALRVFACHALDNSFQDSFRFLSISCCGGHCPLAPCLLFCWINLLAEMLLLSLWKTPRCALCRLGIGMLALILLCTTTAAAVPTFEECTRSLSMRPNLPPLVDLRTLGLVPHSTAVQTHVLVESVVAAAKLSSMRGSHSFVYVPPRREVGPVYTGSFNLTSGVWLCLADGSELVGSDSSKDYVAVVSTTSDTGPFDFPLVGIYNVQNTGIIGSGGGPGVQGTLNGGLNSPSGNHIRSYDPVNNFLLPEEWPLPGCTPFNCRPKLIVAHLSSALAFVGVSIVNSALWTLTLAECNDVLISQSYIYGSRQYPNNDGVDVISTSNVVITDTEIRTGDDCIALITHTSLPVQNVTLHNLALSSSSSAIHLAVFDAEASGDVRDVAASAVTITDSNRGITISPRFGSGSMYNLSFQNISIETRFFTPVWWGVAEPIHISAAWTSEEHQWNGSVHSIRFSNINAVAENSALFYSNLTQGLPPLQDVVLENSVFVLQKWSNVSARGVHDLRPALAEEGGLIPALIDGFYVEGVQNLQLDAVSIVFAAPSFGVLDGECIRTNNATVLEEDYQCLPPESFDLIIH